MRRLDPTTGEVAAFEELVGSHGGLGGFQTRSFMLHPVDDRSPADPVVGAAALHNLMKSWLASARSGAKGAIEGG